MIASHRGGRLVLEDGNHRVEALRRAGLDTAWTVVGFTDAATRDRVRADGLGAGRDPASGMD